MPRLFPTTRSVPIGQELDACGALSSRTSPFCEEFAACPANYSPHLDSLVTDRTLTSFPSIRTDLRNAGANVVDQEASRDGNLATSRSPDDLFPLFRRGSTVQPTGAGNRS